MGLWRQEATDALGTGRTQFTEARKTLLEDGRVVKSGSTYHAEFSPGAQPDLSPGDLVRDPEPDQTRLNGPGDVDSDSSGPGESNEFTIEDCFCDGCKQDGLARHIKIRPQEIVSTCAVCGHEETQKRHKYLEKAFREAAA